MWILFFAAYALTMGAVFVPGFLFLASARFSKIGAACCAPLLSVALYALLAIVYSKLGVASSFFSLVCPVTALGLLVFVITQARARTQRPQPISRGKHSKAVVPPAGIEWGMLVASVAVGFVVVTCVFVKNLDGPTSFMQEYDNWYHLGAIRSFVETGNYSSLSPSIYADWHLRGLAVPYETAGGFYPSAWHGIVALTVTLLGTPITLGINAFNAALVGTVYPVGVYWLLKTLFEENHPARWFGVLAAVSFTAFPWGYVEYGPLYPNLLSSALLPAAMACFINCFAEDAHRADRVRNGIVFFVGCVAILFAQTNGIFTMAIILAPFCVYQAGKIAAGFIKSRRGVVIAQVLVACFIVFIWVWCYSLPAVSEIVHFNWPGTDTFHQALVNAFVLAIGMEPAQLLLALCVFVGFVWMLSRRECRWMAASYLLVFASYCVATSRDDTFKQVLTGFWYTDPRRLAANMAIAGAPLAALGLRQVYVWFKKFFLGLAGAGRAERFLPVASVLAVSAIVALVFYPDFDVKGNLKVSTAFGGLEQRVFVQNDQSAGNVLNPEERTFAENALEMTGDSVIINSPNDGSLFLYGLDDADLMYRTFAVPKDPSKETEASILIRTRLNEISTDDQVKEAVRSVGARYVLVLDQGDDEKEFRRYLGDYNPDQWKGILSITDDTPGFTLLLSEGDMRLYEINA